MESKLGYQMNVFAPTEEIKGRKVLPANTESFSGIIDASVDGVVAPATPIKIVASSSKLPHFAPAASDSDNIVGFLEWNVIRSNGYSKGLPCQISPETNVMYMEASGAINAGVNVAMDSYSNVTIKAAGADSKVIGYALEAASAAGQLIRVKIRFASTQDADLSAYLTSADAASTYQPKLTAGDFVAIDADTNEITTTYSAGTGVSISDAGVISAE